MWGEGLSQALVATVWRGGEKMGKLEPRTGKKQDTRMAQEWHMLLRAPILCGT